MRYGARLPSRCPKALLVIVMQTSPLYPPSLDQCRPGAELSRNPELWDLYTIKDECGPENDCKSYYRGPNPGGLREPVVSRYLYEHGFRLDLPDDRPFAVCLTHDIDDLYPTTIHRGLSGAYRLRRLDFRGLGGEIFWRRDRKGSYSYRNFREIMRIEARYGAKSTFFFMATDRNIDPRRLYDVEILGSELGEIVDAGCEVGLHGGYYSYDSPDAILREKRRLEKALGRGIVGYRNHYLRFQAPETWEHLQAAGFKYDTTLGYNDLPGFRNGMCYPFRPFNRRSGREIDIVEVPLTIMDCSLFSTCKSLPAAWDAARELVDTVERYHGVITLLWHNNAFSAAYLERSKIIYNKILNYCYSKNAWMASCEDIARLKEFYVDQAAE